jgi:SAM-dependent methyltransferase
MAKVIRRAPSLTRYRSNIRPILRAGGSLLRALEYERFSHMALTGRVLDYGGGNRAKYKAKMQEWAAEPGSLVYHSVNIDKTIDPTYILQPGEPLSIPDQSYDTVVSLNTLEHVYDLGFALEAMANALRPGGRLILCVPFLFRVHGHPDDYHRGTANFWEQNLNGSGFSNATFEALTWGPFSNGLFLSGLPGPAKAARMKLALMLDILHARRGFGDADTVSVPQDMPLVAAPLGYFIEAWR